MITGGWMSTTTERSPEGRLRDLILGLSARLASLLEERIDEGIGQALADVGRFTAVDRAYVMTFDATGATFSNTHEWAVEGVSAERDAVQAVPTEHLASWSAALARGSAVQIPRVADLDAGEPLAAAFEAQSIRSMLWVPMPGPRGPLGFVGFDSVRAERTWTGEEVTLLRAAANVIAAALERRGAALERDAVAKRLTSLAALVPGAFYQFELGPDGTMHFPYVSPGMQAVLGIDPEALRRDPARAFEQVHSDDLPGLRASIERSRTTLEEWAHEFRTTSGDGREVPVDGDLDRPRWLRGLATPERLAGGRTIWHGIVTDVTEARALEAALRRDVRERQAAQARLEREVAFRKALVAVTNDLLAATFDDGFYQEVLVRTIELVPDAQAGSLLLRGEDGHFRFVAAAGFDLAALRGVRLASIELGRSDPPAVERIRVRESHHLLGAERSDAFVRAGRLADIEVTLSVPIVVAGEARGFLNLDNFEQRDAFDADAQSIAEALAGQVAVALQRLQLERDLQEERARYERLASHDALTNLPNRRLFLDRLERALTHAHRRKERIALLYLDLDGFKDVNDALGHDTGDELLGEVAARLVEAVRAEDTVARLGGDEFAVVLQEVASDGDVERVAEKLLATFDLPFPLRGRLVAIGASIGVAVYPRDARLSDGLVKAADVAMYRVKAAGKRGIAFHSDEAGPAGRSGS
jgi:diguanylate cyclase (GGDEF)-like protein